MKKVRMSLVGVDGNAFAILGAFCRNAKQQNWSQPEIKIVLDEATSKDYNHLIKTILKYTDE